MSFKWEELEISADTRGWVKLKFGDAWWININPTSRHDFLERVQKAVEMADMADPQNDPDPLKTALKNG